MQPDNYILVKFISKFTSKNFKDTIIIEIKESTTLTGNDKKKLLLEWQYSRILSTKGNKKN